MRNDRVPTQEHERLTHARSTLSGSLLTWLRVTVKWRKLIGRTTAALAVAGCVIAILLPSRYTATVVILPPQLGGASSSAAMMAQLSGMGQLAAAGGGGLGIKNPNDQQVALLKSRTIGDAMVARFHLQQLYHRKYLSTARARWEKHTEIDNGLKDGLIHLSVTDSDPRRAAELANGWLEEYRRFTATLAITEASQRRLFYERQLSIAREDLTRAEENLKQTEQRTGVIDVDGQDRTMIASAAVLRGQLASKQIEIRAMREFAAEQNPDLQRAQQELASIEGQLAAMDAASDRKTGDLIAPKGTVTQASLDYIRALREVKYRETVQDLLTRQFEGARVDEARQGALVQVVDPAVVPDRPTSLYKVWIALAALFCSLPLALLAAVFCDAVSILLRSRRNSNSWATALEGIIVGAWK